MKNKVISSIKTVLVVGTIFGFVGIASAYSTCAPPTGTAPTNNVDAPLNVGVTTQGKAGGLAVGESAMSAPGLTAGLSLEAGGAAAVNGFTNWGSSFFDGNVTVSSPHTLTVGGYPVCNSNMVFAAKPAVFNAATALVNEVKPPAVVFGKPGPMGMVPVIVPVHARVDILVVRGVVVK